MCFVSAALAQQVCHGMACTPHTVLVEQTSTSKCQKRWKGYDRDCIFVPGVGIIHILVGNKLYTLSHTHQERHWTFGPHTLYFLNTVWTSLAAS